MRRKTRPVRCGQLMIGGEYPISVQSMTTTDPLQVQATIDQIGRLEEAGCELVRVAVPTLASAQAIGQVKQGISIPLVADVHFDYRIALEAIRQGVDGLRINPGNIGDADRVEQVVKAAKERQIPIRIGVNAGSLERHLLEQYGHPTAEAMVASALHHVRMLEALDFEDIVISLKASSIRLTVEAYEKMAEVCEYPFHLGITEAGTPWAGTVKSSIGIGAMLLKGLGDTLRVSLTGDPVEEIKVGRQILHALGITQNRVTLISCPTCGRCQIDLIGLAQQVEERIGHLDKPITIAVMGCAVNGPGEAREADIGIAGGVEGGLLFKRGQVVRKVPESQLLSALLEEIEKL